MLFLRTSITSDELALRSDCILDNLPKERKRWSSTSFFDGRPAGFSFYRGISRGTPFASEVELVLAFANGIRQWDPDILCGYDVQRRVSSYCLAKTHGSRHS